MDHCHRSLSEVLSGSTSTSGQQPQYIHSAGNDRDTVKAIDHSMYVSGRCCTPVVSISESEWCFLGTDVSVVRTQRTTSLMNYMPHRE